MLNELYDLSVVLKEVVSIPPEHDKLRSLPSVSEKKPCYRILISSDGSILGVEPIKKELVACLRKWEPSNGNSFPGFNIHPLYRLADKDRKKHLKKWREGKEPLDLTLLKDWCSEEKAKNWDAKSEKKMDKCLGTIPRELQEKCADIPNDFCALKNLFRRIINWGDGRSVKFFQAIESYIWKSLEKDGRALSLLSVLIHEGSSDKKPENDRGTVSIFMDVPDWKEYPVAHERTIECINECLLQTDGTRSTETGYEKEDAFGLDGSGYKDKLPDVRLPFIGKVILRAMNKESPCQYRYGTIDAKSFRIGTDSRKRAKGALKWLGSDERKGKTWGWAGGKELIFAYPAVLPEAPPKLTALFGANKSGDSEARFENYAKDVVDCLKGLGPSLKNIDLHVFSLRKMDTARTKVVFHRNYSAQRLADAAREWQQGCANIPIIRIRSWGEEKGKTVLIEPEIPFPLQIADCLNRVWKQDGTSKCEVKSISKFAGIELLLDESAALRQISHILAVALQNSKGLFFSLGDSLHRNEVFKLDGFNKHKQLMPAILGLLLWKLGIGKERYMNIPSYLVGRMLKLADELHALYCKEVRKNNLPSQLLGNALMVAALDSPTQALSQLAMRIVPYLGWARTNSTESAGLSRYFLKEFGLVEAKLRDVELPLRFDDPERAQLLLGYISGNSQTDEPANI
ncbi:MAG: hypothetical protein SWQ30_18505 [Thermodesulfobacteriota bacterium]|nr:hypothetical protein [Thermodesulfobacteriota bacterium]